MRNHSDNFSSPPDDLEVPSSSTNSEEYGDQLDTIEDHCISQSACQFLDKGKVKTLKKSRGRKILRQLQEEEATVKGFTSIFKFLGIWRAESFKILDGCCDSLPEQGLELEKQMAYTIKAYDYGEGSFGYHSCIQYVMHGTNSQGRTWYGGGN
ncbi:hypothetical protein SUGI_0961390 [Cryptomeria japonica]|nr:hypothetical protein SUGI_0961390 [Cryptomeria japonica]